MIKRGNLDATVTTMSESKITLSKEIGERLRGTRKGAGLSLSQLAERTGGRLSKSRISNYEQGLRRMGVEEARELAAALGTISPGYLLCLDDPWNLDADEIHILNCYRTTDDRGRAFLRDVAKTLDQGDGGQD